MSEEEIIHGCMKHERASQRALCEIYSERMMEICIRYSKNHPDAKEIFLDGFKNIFNNFSHFAGENAKRKKDGNEISLEEWIQKEIISSAIRHMHANKREYFVSSTVNARDLEKPVTAEISDEQIMKSADRKIIVKALQQLSPSYRAVYNLYEMDGYSYGEISKLLDISEYTAKDSLSKAKFNLRKNIARMIPQ
ncbi:MAG: sigma-70 family RNA polymerase sigma factor [Bacteroidetes bacterium]|nr:sigma-70 family RNA polymerase sigma factor [Bacteroidota bacterium]